MMPQTSMTPNLLEPLEVVPQFLVDLVRQDVRVFTVDHVFLPVQEPGGDLELGGVLHDGYDSLELVRVEFSGTGVIS